MVWKAVNRPTDIPVACGEAESLSLQGLTPSQVGKEGRVYFQTWQDSGSSDPSNLNSRNHVRRWVVRDWIVIPKEDMVVLEKTPESPLRVPGGQVPCDPSQIWRGPLRFLPPFEMRPSSIAPNPVE